MKLAPQGETGNLPVLAFRRGADGATFNSQARRTKQKSIPCGTDRRPGAPAVLDGTRSAVILPWYTKNANGIIMIYDAIAHLSALPLPADACNQIAAFVNRVAPLPAGRHVIDGSRIYASIFSYATTAGSTPGVFEAHRNYLDLQLLLSGEERIGVTQERLAEHTPYDAAGDAVLYAPPATACSEIVLRPGLFLLLLPRDSHRPGLATTTAAQVTKVVIKIAVDLLGERH